MIIISTRREGEKPLGELFKEQEAGMSGGERELL